MDLLLTSELFTKFFQTFSQLSKNQFETSLSLIVTNKSNKFLLSKKLLDKIELAIKGNQIAEAYFKNFLTQLINIQGINVSGGQNINEIDILIEMEKNYNLIPVNLKSDVYLNLSETNTLSLNNSHSIIYSQSKFPNKHFIGWYLASESPKSISIRYYDVTSNQEIEDIFHFALKLSSSPSVDLFDRYSNINHTLFDPIKVKHVNYYSSFKQAPEEGNENFNLKANFPVLKIFKARKFFTHERKLICGNLIIEVDEDFGNINIAKSTWKIDITYCQITSQKLSIKKTIARYRLVV